MTRSKLANLCLLALIAPLIPGVIMGLKGYGWLYLSANLLFDVCFGGLEAISVKTRKKSISQDIASTPAWLFAMIIVTWTVMQVGVAAHWALMR